MKRIKTKTDFKDRVKYFADKTDIKIKNITVRPMKNKWASCSLKGNMAFNDELIGMNNKIINYVIVHELLHIKIPNHGKLWKALMIAYVGDYEKVEKRMKKLKLNTAKIHQYEKVKI